MSKRIKLTKGQYAIVDNDDYEQLNRHKWYAEERTHRFYARRARTLEERAGVEPKCRLTYMHREILFPSDNALQVDHINHDGLDNRRCNLRPIKPGENQRNMRKRTPHSSIYKGVSWQTDKKKWRSMVCCNRKDYYLGLFDNEKDAAIAYNKKAAELFGELAYLNEIQEENKCKL